MLIYNKFNTKDGRLFVKEKLDLFKSVIKKFEDIYDVRPFNQQSPQSLLEIYLLARSLQCKTIFELGCGSRSSTYALSIAAHEFSHACPIHAVDISPINFEKFMAENFPQVSFSPITDHAQEATTFEINPAWGKPILTFYDAHDGDIPGVKIFPYALANWFPKLSGQVIAIHDCSVFAKDDPYPETIKDRLPYALHYEGRIVQGYDEVPSLLEWMNRLKIPFFRPGDELEKLGFEGHDSSLIYFYCP